MSVDAPVHEEAAADPVAMETSATVDFKRSHRQTVFAWRDLFTPVMAALVLLGLYLDVSRRDLDTIESNVLNRDTLTRATVQHVYLSVAIAVLVLVVAVPLGVLVTRKATRRLAPFVLALANIGQAAPSLGLLALVGIYAIGFWPVVLILTGYSALSVLRNTIVGLESVDSGVLDAARGMGMSPLAVLLRVELPLAVPVIGAGARTALVLAVGTVPLGYALNAGGLGLPLFGAIKTNRPVVTFTVAVMIAVLALLMDWAAGVLQRAATPKGIR